MIFLHISSELYWTIKTFFKFSIKNVYTLCNKNNYFLILLFLKFFSLYKWHKKSKPKIFII